MEKRKPELTQIIHLLGKLTNDNSLEYTLNLDINHVMNSFRRLWIQFENPLSGLKIKFTDNIQNTKDVDFWLSDTETYSHCDKCNEKLNLIFHFNTNQIFFDLEPKIYLLCYCVGCDIFKILVSEVNITPTNYITISKIKPFSDIEKGKYDIPIPESENCENCPVNDKLKMVKIIIPNNDISKIGGRNEEINRIKLEVLQYRECKCYNSSNANIILSLKAFDCEILRRFNILALIVSECDTCNYLHFDLYSHQLDIEYETTIYNHENTFYHVIISNDKKINGTILETDFRTQYIQTCGKLINFNLDTNNNLEYTSIRKVDSPLIEKYFIDIPDDKFKKISDIFKKIKNNKEIELEDDKQIHEKYGENFYITSSLKTIPKCLVEMKGDKLIFHGKFDMEDELCEFAPWEQKLIQECGGIVDEN